MKKLYIEPGCISCGACQYTAPEIFEVTDRSRVKLDADLEAHHAKIQQAVKSCPVSVIKYE